MGDGVKALAYHSYGGPEVLVVEDDLPEPHARPGQVRIRTRAVSVNPYDWKLRAGWFDGLVPLAFPAIPGVDGAGVVDEIGDDVEGVQLGDEVFGIGDRMSAEYAVLDHFFLKPVGMSWEEAAALPHVTESAARCLAMLGVKDGDVLLIDGAAGGVGTSAVQLAVSRGATVIGTASENHHDYLRGLGALPTTYGPGLAERVRDGGLDRVDAVLDAAGTDVPQLVQLVSDPAQVVSLADFAAPQHGARFADVSGGRAVEIFPVVADQYSQGTFRISIERVLPLAQAPAAHEASQQGHVCGKIVLTI
jgi:NADPH:quinone reductase-like Zn-dependent oxidoreductase